MATKEQRQYRVVWQRKRSPEYPDYPTRRYYAKYDRRDAAERKALRLQGRFIEARCLVDPGGVEPEDFVHCDNPSCRCGAETWGEREARFREETQPLELLRIESRPVGKWETEEDLLA